MADDGAPPVVKPETINIVVRDQTGGEVQFKIKSHTKFSKVLAAYCQKKGVDESTVKFLLDGQRINSDQTPGELEMEDGDNIDAVITQIGGAHALVQQQQLMQAAQ